MNSDVDSYFQNTKIWTKELEAIRTIILETGLTEELKWRQPCYTHKNTNVLIIGEFKDYCVISFLKGVLLQDIEGILHKPGENSQSAKMMKFTNLEDIIKLKTSILAYIFEAIEIENLGLKVDTSQSKNLVFPEELHDIFKENPEFEKAFLALTVGRQRAYNMHFTETKQAKTRMQRIQKYLPRIMSGKGLNDCICGLSKRMPTCDGSHKYINN